MVPVQYRGQDFYPRSPCGERPPRLSRVVPTPIFLSTLSLRRATLDVTIIGRTWDISIHALLAESDTRPRRGPGQHPDFYPRSPCGERRLPNAVGLPVYCNFYPRSPCGERLPTDAQTHISLAFLSTLSLRRATVVAYFLAPQVIFLSTLSLRRATVFKAVNSSLVIFLSTLSLRRATKICKYVARRNVISIHALLAESDIYCHLSGASYSISIHALLAESDGPWSTLPIGMANFYPRSPCGERLVVDGHRVHITRFLSTLSLRRATFRTWS